MDPSALKIAKLKDILRQHGLSTTGNKAELVERLQRVDPSGVWMNEDDIEDSGQTEEAHAERVIQPTDESQAQREMALLSKERDLMQKEIELLRRKNNLLRASPGSSASTTFRTTLSIKNISDLLSEYNGSGDDFERWRAQINLLRDTYELDENAAKVLVGSKL